MAAAKKTKAKKRNAASTVKVPTEICFAIMPFGGWLDGYYESIYCPAIKAAGLLPHRADDLYRPSTIVNDIWAYTKKAKLLIADLTGKNPNVFYELGLAHALAKPAILVAESMDDIPFDLRALRIITYDKNAPDWGVLLRSKVEQAIKEVLVAPVAAVLPAFLEVDVTTRPKVTSHEKDLIEIKQELDLLRREIRSGSLGSNDKVDIGPAAAIKMIHSLLRNGVPDDQIISRVAPLGPPVGWIMDEIKNYQKRHVRRIRSGAQGDSNNPVSG
jgi:hypothetical protein